MNKKIFAITVLLFLIIGISAVHAEEINQTEDNLEISDSDILSAGTVKSYTGLLNDISKSPETGFNVQSDYKFNPTKDENLKNGISLTVEDNSEYIIEGHNHVINANNQAGIFKFTNGTVYINNLKLINADRSSIILNNCILYTKNVTFENNYDSEGGAAVYSYGSNYYSTKDKFINNDAKMGASIFGQNSIVEIDRSTFVNAKELQWGLIYTKNSITTVKNTVFANMTSKYATAIFCQENKLNVLNSRFINLFAKNTAGAIGVKSTLSVNIDGCRFVNVSSGKNGGAVYADINEDNVNYKYGVTVKNSLFEKCSSEFGGAYVQLGGQLKIIDTNFKKNVAEYSGGAIYLSNTTATISNAELNRNKANQFYGGAAYIDDSKVIIASCDVLNNIVGTEGSGVYLYSSQYEIKNSNFAKNNYNVIVSYFDRKGSSLKNNEMNGGKTLLNQVEYTSVVDYAGEKIILDPVKVKETAKSSKFDLRKYNLAGVVKDQGFDGSCWAFAATGALESAFLKATGILLDISENNIQNSALHYGTFGTDSIFESGYSTSAMGLFLAWLGTLPVNYDTYDELGKITLTAFAEDSYHIQDTIIIPERANALDNAKLKDALIKYGGLTVHLYGASANNEYYNENTHAQYYNGKSPGNHFVTLVGWDDNYSKKNFIITPKGNGAWICKNSWGSEWGEDGYFYVSYYDTTFAMKTTSVGYIINNTESYERAYQYDIGRMTRYYAEKTGDDIRFVNTYTAIDNEIISAIGTYFEKANEKYKITIYVDGKTVYSQSGKSTHGGFSTIDLNKQIAVNQDHEFSVEIKAKAMPLLEDTRIHFEKEKSVAYYIDGGYEDLGPSGITACIKAYTFTNPNPGKTKAHYNTKNNKVTVKSNANGKIISIVKDNKILGSATVTNGEAIFDLDLEPGTYSVDTPYDDDDDILEWFEILDSIELDDYITIGFNVQTPIEAEFLDMFEDELSNTTVIYELDGESFSGTTDNKGILSLDLSDLSIGEHALFLENPDTLEETFIIINVVSRFSENSDVNMRQGDGSSFKVLVHGDDGNPVGADETVSIRLNGKTYDVKTDSDGYAVLTIPDSLKSGTYTLTATYAGQIIKNTVKVTSGVNPAKSTVKSYPEGKTPVITKKVTSNFNTKTYNAKITLKQSVDKKLKTGTNFKYNGAYLKNGKIIVKSNANGAKISIVKNNKVIATAVVINGEAIFDLDLEPGTYSIIVQSEDSEKIIESFEIISAIDLGDAIITGEDAQTTLEIEFVDEDSFKLSDTNVTFYLDGEKYTEPIENGTISINMTDLTVGNHTFVVENPVNSQESATTIEVVRDLVAI
ncbi:MAG: hypothetical protein E7Z77_01165 [Methanobrevibacter sp.]|uniref:C1 family peptidase n=1 Tax=Methanobrevibacter sp. TaxID=66852 RepID=UPI0025E21111|nr:C1 family peptidase [Methanobrevibacter sp.]MBE6508001.1 hypothetical protein [Methanobrevibacter sp.]